jgi:sugar phosphate permease
MTQFAIAPISPFVLEDFQIGKRGLGLLSSAIVLGVAVAGVWSGMLVDVIGVRQMTLLGPIFVGIWLSMFFARPTFTGALVLLFLVGVGLSSVISLTNVGVLDWFSRSERGFALGLKQSGAPLGVGLSALVMPQLASYIGWQSALALLGASMMVIGVLACFFYREGPSRTRKASPEGWTQFTMPATLRTLFQDPNLAWLCCLGFSFTALQITLVTFLVPYLKESLNMSVARASFYLALSQIAGTVARLATGLLSDRILMGRRKGLLSILAFFAVGAVAALSFDLHQMSQWTMGILILLVGSTATGWVGIFFAAVVEQAQAGTEAATSGLSVATLMLGAMSGPLIFGYIVDSVSYRFALVSFSAWLGLSGLLFVSFFRENAPPYQTELK